MSLPVDSIHFLSFPFITNLYDNRSLGSDKKPLVGSNKIDMKDLLRGTSAAAAFSFASHPASSPTSEERNMSSKSFAAKMIVDSPRPDIINADEDDDFESSILTVKDRFQLGREVLDGPLEATAAYKVPFREYIFSRPGENKIDVGRMKARLTVLDSADAKPTLHNFFSLVRPELKRKKFVVRVYITQGSNFRPSGTDDITMKPKKPKPFLEVSLGANNVAVDRGSGAVVTLEDSCANQPNSKFGAGYNVDFYKYFEIITTLPGSGSGGVSTLEVSAWNEEDGQTDSRLIGSTSVDLLDRFHSESWNDLGKEHRVELDRDSEDAAKINNVDGGVNYDMLDDIAVSFRANHQAARISGEAEGTHCDECNAKYSEKMGGYHCYCAHIKWIRRVHQRLDPKPAELRQLKVPTSHLPRGCLRMWVDIIPQSEAKQFPPSYYLKNNHVKTLFLKLRDGRKFKNFDEQDLMDDIDQLTGINKAAVFFGTTSGNSMLRQCIEFNNEKLLRYYLRLHPLAAFVRVRNGGDEGGTIGDNSDDDDDDEYDDDDDDDDDDDGDNDDGDGGDGGEEDEEDEEEKEEEPEVIVIPQGGYAPDHVVRSPPMTPDTRRKFLQRKASKKGGLGGGRKTYLESMDCFDFAISQEKFQIIQVMLDEISKPLILKTKFLPEPLTRHLKCLMRHEYHELVAAVIKSLPLVCKEKEDDPDTVVLSTALPDLGTLSFLTQLTDNAATDIFDCDTMAMVVERLWEDHISSAFKREFMIFCTFCAMWIVFCEFYSHSVDFQTADWAWASDWQENSNTTAWVLFFALGTLNTFFVRKEFRQAKKQAEQREGLNFNGDGEDADLDHLGAWIPVLRPAGILDGGAGMLGRGAGLIVDGPAILGRGAGLIADTGAGMLDRGAGLIGSPRSGTPDRGEGLIGDRGAGPDKNPKEGKKGKKGKHESARAAMVTMDAENNFLKKYLGLHLPISAYTSSYFSDTYNRVDFLNIILVYSSLLIIKFKITSPATESGIASFATLTLTYKTMSYMRGFSETGWLSKVLNQNIIDMKAFSIIIIILICGFTVVFRLLMNKLPNGGCDPVAISDDAVEAIEWDCAKAPYQDFGRSMFNVFLMSVLGDFDAGAFDDVEHANLSKVFFTIMMVGITVVALNAIIALLGDSYASVKENKNANMRSERANLILEHLLVMPRSKRKDIEKKTRTPEKEMSKKEYLGLTRERDDRIFESDVDDIGQGVDDVKDEVKMLREGMAEMRVVVDKLLADRA